MVPLFGAANAAPNKGTTILFWFRSPKTVLNPPVSGKIQVLFKAFKCFSSTFQGKYSFQGLFKPVRTLHIILTVPLQAASTQCMKNFIYSNWQLPFLNQPWGENQLCENVRLDSQLSIAVHRSCLTINCPMGTG